MQGPLDFLWQIATVATIVIATRWLFNTRGAKLPTTRDGSNLYRVKAQWRAVGIGTAVFSAALAIWSLWSLPSASGWVSLALFSPLAAGGVWIASGSIVTDRIGISKKVLWHSSSFRWDDVTEVRLLQKQGAAIEIKAGTRRIVIDSRISAFEHLWNRLITETGFHQTAENAYTRG